MRYIALLNLSARLPTLGCISAQREIARVVLVHIGNEENEVGAAASGFFVFVFALIPFPIQSLFLSCSRFWKNL